MKKNLKAPRTPRRATPTVLADAVLAGVTGGDNGVIHVQNALGGGAKPSGIQGWG